MTKQEKIIVSAYTGVLMCDFDDVHEYIQKKLGRPVYTHELADKGIQKEVKEKSHEDFLEICNREESEQNWIPCSERLPKKMGYYLTSNEYKVVHEDYYWGSGCFEKAKKYQCEVVAWMPMPIPPYCGDNGE